MIKCDLRHFVMSLSIVVLLSLGYVWQQAQIIRLAYHQNYNSKSVKELLDKNHYLKYNLIYLKASSYLGNKLFNGGTDFEIPQESKTIRLTLSNTQIQDSPEKKTLEFGRSDNTTPLSGIWKEKIILGIFKTQEVWPLSAINSYVNQQAQAGVISDKRE